MFRGYIATEEDLRTIEEGISYVWKSELEYIFKDKSRMENTVIISYDPKHIYLFGHNKPVEKIIHNVEIDEGFLRGWNQGIKPKELNDYLPKYVAKATWWVLPKISGPLLNPMMEAQKKLNVPFNAYTTKESYLATIVHEFGHVYFNSFKLWYFSDLRKNLSYMNIALKLFEGGDSEGLDTKVQFPLASSLTEVFAFCTDYSASTIFWPQHKKDIDTMQAAEIKKIIEKESKLNLDEEDSYLSDRRYGPHLLAAISGKMLLSKEPTNWPGVLLEMNSL